VRVVVADDNLLMREGVARVLAEAGFAVAGQCGDAEELVRAIDAQPPDVAIVDIRMPPTHTDEGLQAAREIRARHPRVGVLVLSQYVELGLAMQLLSGSMEGVGYLLKDRVGDLAEFAAAVRRVGAGGSAVDPEIVCQLLRRRGAEPLAALTAREREVLELMAEGRSNQGIADRLGVSERAVQKHITSIFAKLDLGARDDDHRRVLAVLAFLRAHPAG
jgi:DNA-binding NarL/FixJ family response regulator